jgi:hypothetical protein
MKANLFLSALWITALSSGLAWGTCLTLEKGLDRYCARSPKDDIACHKSNKKTYGFHEESCFLSNYESIKAIYDLENNDILPPEVLQKYSIDSIARTLVFRNFQKNIRPRLVDEELISPSRDLYADSQFQMSVHLKDFPGIIANGFKNQHQTHTTAGCNCVKERSALEDILLGITIEETYDGQTHLERKANHIRPKYCFYGFSKFAEGYTPGYQSQYGEIVAVFKNTVKKKATVTQGDSLDIGSKVQTWSPYYEATGETFPLKGIYYEAQLWGEIGISDVAHFLVGCFKDEAENVRGTAKKILSNLSNAGLKIPLYTCQTQVLENEGNILKMGKQITLANLKTLPVGTPAATEDATEEKPADPFIMSIVSASYGLNLSVKNKNNVLEEAKKHCDESESCVYKIDPKYFGVGDLDTEKGKSFSISWRCKNSKITRKLRSKSLPADATGKELTLSCSP